MVALVVGASRPFLPYYLAYLGFSRFEHGSAGFSLPAQ